MVTIGYFIGAPIAIILLIVFFTLYIKSKRLKELQINDVSKLKQGKVHNVFSLNFPLTEEKKQNVLIYLNSIDAKTLEGTNKEIISYINANSKALLGGIFNLEATKFPIRIIVFLKENRTEIQMDDNYGFQKFKGNAKNVFEQKNKEAFEYHFSIISQLIN
jgi:hypothetical protein